MPKLAGGAVDFDCPTLLDALPLLSDAFSTMEGCNLELYVIRQRVAAAQQLLRDTLLPVDRIARQLGHTRHEVECESRI
jgi:hypothetical protein